MKFTGKTGEVRFNKINERVVDRFDIVNVKRLEQDGAGDEEISVFEKVNAFVRSELTRW